MTETTQPKTTGPRPPKPKAKPGWHNVPECGWDITHRRGDLPFRSDAQPLFYRGHWFCDDLCVLSYKDAGHKPLSDEQREALKESVRRSEAADRETQRKAAERNRRQQELERQA